MEPLADGDPRQIGPYRVEARLGAGGMGQVFLGATPTGRKVAVKFLKAELADSPAFRTRFAREVAAARQVSGLHTAQVLDADAQAERPWLATAYIAGPTLHEVVQSGGPFAVSAVRALGASLAEGLGAIHACGLVHRDLKPGNVLMAADGPRIIDFGIASATGSSTLTEVGTLVGTYAYMSPEQITADATGPGSDVFALGCVLGFAATGAGPFDATSIPAIIHRILHEAPRLHGIPEDLRTVIVSCLAKDAAARPSTAEIVTWLTASALDSQAGHQVPVRLPATLVDPAPEILYPAPGPANVPTWQIPTGHGHPPNRLPQPAPASRGLSRRTIISGAAAVVAVIAVPTVVLLANSGNGTDDEPTTPFNSDPEPATTPFAVLDGHEGGINSVVFQQGGRLLISGGDDKIVRVWDMTTGEVSTQFTGHTGPIRALAFTNSNANQIASGGDDRSMRYWSLDGKGNKDRGMTAQSIVSTAGTLGWVAYGLKSGDIELWSANAEPAWQVFTGAPSTSSVAMGYAPRSDAAILASGEREGKDSLVRVWENWISKRSELLHELAGHTDDINAVAMSFETLASASSDKTIRIWDLGTGKTSVVLEGHTAPVLALAFAEPGTSLASAAADGTIRVWDIESGKTTATLTGTPQQIKSLAYGAGAKGQTIAVCGGDTGNPNSDTIRLWRFKKSG